MIRFQYLFYEYQEVPMPIWTLVSMRPYSMRLTEQSSMEPHQDLQPCKVRGPRKTLYLPRGTIILVLIWGGGGGFVMPVIRPRVQASASSRDFRAKTARIFFFFFVQTEPCVHAITCRCFSELTSVYQWPTTARVVRFGNLKITGICAFKP